MAKIDSNLPTEILVAVAEACGFHVAYDRRPGTDEWTLSAGHGVFHVQHVGTRQDVCAFLTGYAAMQIQTTQILNDTDNAQRRLILGMRERLHRGSGEKDRHVTRIEADRRGGSSRTAVCCCGWMGPERSTMELAADDALMHESSDHHIVKR